MVMIVCPYSLHQEMLWYKMYHVRVAIPLLRSYGQHPIIPTHQEEEEGGICMRVI